MSAAAPDGGSDWRIVAAQTQVGKLVIRLRQRKPVLAAGAAPYADAIEITWRYTSDNGMPPPAENQLQLAFETALDDLSGDNGLAELVQVSTGDGRKEWLYYSCDRARFMAEFNRLLAGQPRFPLQIAFYEDPDWRLWQETINAVASRTAPET